MAESNVESPMTGNVIEIPVTVGQSVEEGDLLIVIESMKMENEVFSEVSGTITSILAKEEQNVGEEEVLMTISTE
jgi:biotin carboxyl carrier protein